MKQYVIIQGMLAVAVTRYTEFDRYVEVFPQDLVKVLSAPRGVYLKPRQLKFVGDYTIIEQRERGIESK